MSALARCSHRLTRKAPSSLTVETLGEDEGLANGIYLQAMFTQLAFSGSTALDPAILGASMKDNEAGIRRVDG